MRRRSKSNSSSLDLFLDTICNTFGGIMFMAILLSVLVQMRSKSPTEKDPDTVPMSAQEAREMEAKLTDLAAEHRSLSNLILELRRNQPRPEDAAVRQRQLEADQELERLQKAVDQQTKIAQELAQQVKETAELNEEIDLVKTQLLEAQAALQREKKAWDDSLADKMETLKLPKVQTSTKMPAILLMRYGKIYAMRLTPTSKYNDDDVIITELSSDSFTAAPRSGRGWDLTDNKSALDTYLSQHSSYAYAVSIIVWPDSFEQFAPLKQILIERGYQYQLQPIPNMTSCPFGRTNQLPRVQ